ncbi:MAG TPA: ABC transporter substrate-binding protein [Candidatus Binatia bacterium]|jgi:NitT/TauT family transport system substrate-binding protein|nr:ABC transporter substrate-binding protein [Candidatus Binatia bacterium]
MSRRSFLVFGVFLIIIISIGSFEYSYAQQGLKRVRLSVSSSTVALLAIFAPYDKGFFRDEGIDLEIIHMSANLASTAVLTGDLDYNGAVTGVIGAAVQNRPMKVLIFTVARPLVFLMSKKEIKEPRDLKGKKVAGSTPGGSATLLANQALRHIGLEPGRDVSILPMGGTAAGRLAVLESGAVDASILSVPENIVAREKGYNELLFLGDVVEFAQSGFGATEKRIRENPDEIYRMVRAILRGLMFIWDKNRQGEVVDLIMKRWKLNDRKMAESIFRDLSRVLTKDASVKPESIQLLIDLARESAKVTRPVKVDEVVDYSFVEKARRELGLAK